MTQYEQITQSPETLGAFLAALSVIDGPWDREFQAWFAHIARRKIAMIKYPQISYIKTAWLLNFKLRFQRKE